MGNCSVNVDISCNQSAETCSRSHLKCLDAAHCRRSLQGLQQCQWVLPVLTAVYAMDEQRLVFAQYVF